MESRFHDQATVSILSMKIAVILGTRPEAIKVTHFASCRNCNKHSAILELIVIDDGSTDSTQEILQGFGSRIDLKAGLSSTRNSGMKAAIGSII